ncbi:MAG: porin family protein [Candidatus Latescibacteria bacterium]|nr:porin family protein [Candidatus Latescibacterota bacterium]
MKRALTTFGFSLLGCMLVGSAHAQVGSPPEEAKYFRIPTKFHLFVELGGSLPTSPGVYNDLWNSAFQFGAGGGVNVISWLDVCANFTYASWENNSTDSKSVIGYVGVPDVEGGLITTMTISGSARFVAVPSARTNPYAEFSVGYYTTSADPITIEGVLENTMEDCSGMMLAPAVGVQYALADSWGAYAKYSYVYCSSSEFAPGDLLLPEGGGEPTEGDNQIFQTILVGIMLRF